jgi:hypothetical protein
MSLWNYFLGRKTPPNPTAKFMGGKTSHNATVGQLPDETNLFIKCCSCGEANLFTALPVSFACSACNTENFLENLGEDSFRSYGEESLRPYIVEDLAAQVDKSLDARRNAQMLREEAERQRQDEAGRCQKRRAMKDSLCAKAADLEERAFELEDKVKSFAIENRRSPSHLKTLSDIELDRLKEQIQALQDVSRQLEECRAEISRYVD